MTIDQRIREDLRAAASVVSSGRPARVDIVVRRGRRRRHVRRARWVLLSTIPLVVFLTMAGRIDPNAVDPAGTHGVETVEIADLAVPVVDSEPILTDPDVWLGLPGPSPRFDTTPYGADRSFAPGQPKSDLDERLNMAVYLGELDGEPFYVYSQSAPSIWDRISEMVFGNLSADTLGTSLNCCSGGDMDHEGGLPGMSMSSGTGLPDLIVVEWLGLTPDVSVVAFEVDGAFIGWQTPVGGTVSLRLEDRPGNVAMVALNQDGEELDRFDPGDIAPSQSSTFDSPEETALDLEDFVSDELQIELSDVHPPELRDLIEVRSDTRLFAVPIDGSQVYAVVGTEEDHFYSESCEVLESDAIPDDLEATCLMRTVNGVTEIGVFNLHEGTGQGE